MPLRALAPATYERVADVTAPDADSIVGRLRSGSLHAVAEAYDLHHQALRAFSQRLLGDAAAAEDLVQETFIALQGAIDRYDGTCSLRTFLMSIAANRARHYFRTAARRRAAMARYEESADEPPPSTPEDRVDRGRLADTLLRLLERLPAHQRIAFVLCEVEERTSSEAAVILGASQATVRSRLWHAKKKLRKAIARGGKQ